MALPLVDMNKCCKKKKCQGGPNACQVYDTCDPCQGLGDFNPATCDCEIKCEAPQTVIVEWKVSYATYNTGCDPTTKLCFAFGDTRYSYQISDMVPGSSVLVTTQGTGVFGNCSGTENTVTVATYLGCVAGSPAFKTTVLGAPGCSVNSSSGAIATPYDVLITYY